MGQHFLFHRDLVAATAVHHAVNARLSTDFQSDLVLLGPQWLRIYRVEPVPSPGEAANGQVLHLQASFPVAGVAESVHVLRFDRNLLRKKHRFFGGEDVLLLTFPRFKWVIVGYDRRAQSLATLAMFSFEEDAIGPGATLKGEKNGREQLVGLATRAAARVDPQTRCGAMLVYSDQLVIVPFRSESMELSFFDEEEDEDEQGTTTADSDEEEEEDDEEEKKLEELVKQSKHRGVTSDMSNTLHALLDKSVKVGAKRKRNHMSGLMPNELTGREFLLRLRELEITGKVIDLAFLDGYLEPTLMVLHEENERNSTFGRLAVGFDTYCLTVMSINMNTRLHPKIWTVKNLPSDCFRLIPCRAPLGGVVVLSANAFLYFNQTQFYGLATNVFASKTVNQSVLPLSDAVYETPDRDTAQLNIVLYDCQYEYLHEKELLLTMPSGEVYVLSLPYEKTSSRGLYGFGGASSSRNVSLSLRMLQSGILANCLCMNDEKRLLFVGSRSGDSVLYALDQKKMASAYAEDEESKEVKDEEMPTKEDTVVKEATPPVKSEPTEEEEEDEDDLFLYGTAPIKEDLAAATDLTETSNGTNGLSMRKGVNDPFSEEGCGPCDYELRQIDVLPGIGQITSIELGVESSADSNEKREELVISGGFERNGAISVLHNGLRPIVGTEAELSGCRAMWTVSSLLSSATKDADGQSYDAYLILSVAHRTMVLRTGEGMEPLEDDSGFYTSGPTLAAANLFNKQRIVQIFKQGARVMMEVPEEEAPNSQEKAEKTASANEEDEDDEGPRVKLVCTQEITLEGDVECGGMNVDTSSVGIVSVDVIDPYILLLLTDGSIRLLMGDEEDLELTVIDPEIDYLDVIVDSNETTDLSKHGSSSACLFYDWAGMFRENAWGEDEREESSESAANEIKKENADKDDDMDILYSTKTSVRATSVDCNSKSKSVPIQAFQTNTDGSVSIPLLKQKDAKMMCGMCFGDGSLHVFSLPDFKKRGVFPYLTFAPQSLVNTLEHYQVSKKKTVKFSAPILGLNASTSSANDGRIKKSHTINSPVADIIIHRVGPSEGQHNAQYLSQMIMLVFLANGDLLMYSVVPKAEGLRLRVEKGETTPVFHFVRVGTDLITRPFLPPRARTNAHNESGNNPEVNTSAVLAKLRAGFRYPMLTSFTNVNNMSGAFFRGAHPMWIVGDRGQPTFVPMCVTGSAPPAPRANGASNKNVAPRVSVPVLSFTPFHHWNCPNGFIYFHSRGALRVCELPSSRTSTILPSSGGFVLQKAEFGATLHHMLYLGSHGPGGVAEALEVPTYAVVCSIKMMPADAERATEVEGVEEEQELENLDANGNPIGSNVMAPTAEMFPDHEIDTMALTEEDVYELRLVQTDEFGEWGRRGVFRVHFERYEVVLSVKLMYLYDSSLMKEEVSSTSPEWNKKKRPYLVVGTGWVSPHGEDESGRGRLLLYELDYAQYVNEEGGATSRKLPKLRLVFIKEHRQGAISMVTQLGPYVLAAVGSKLIVYEFKSEQLIGCAFYDAQMFIVTLSVVKDFVMYGDVYKSVHFLRWRENQRQLMLLAKDYEPLAVSATEFSVFEKKLALLAVDMDENLHVMQFAPQDIESRGGQRLLRVSDFHLGVQVASMFRKRVDAPSSIVPATNGRATAPPSCYVNVMGNSEGGVSTLIPVSERVFRRLFTLQNVMVNTLPQNCALNPREFRMLKTNAQRRCGRPDAWSKKKWKKSFLDAFVLFRFLLLDYVAQKELARCIGTTPEVVIHNLLEVQHATATFL